MAGTAADGELTAAQGTRFAEAQIADDAAIRQLLRDNPMRGAVSVTFEREPAYFHGANIAGGRDRTIVAFSQGRLACMGRGTRRQCWVNGQETAVGYLAELRLSESAPGRFDILRAGYRFFHEQERENPAEAYFTSIGADNERAMRLLERGARGLPKYEFLAGFETLLIAIPRRPRPARLRVEPASPQHLPAMQRLLNEHGRRHQLGAVWTEEIVRDLQQHGLPLDRFLLAFEGEEIVACGALWDQRDFRQTVIRGYAPMLSFFRPVLNAASGLFGTQRLPSPGTVLASAFISPLAFAEGAATMLPDFAEAFFAPAAQRGVGFLTVGRPADAPEIPVLRRRFTTRTWCSRLYQVQWPGERSLALQSPDAAFLPDVALL